MYDKRTIPQTRSVVGSAAGIAQIPPNDSRCAIVLSTVSGRITYIILGAGDGANVGPSMVGGASPVVLSEAQIGSAIREAIQLVDSAGASQTYGYIEILESP